MNVIQFPNPDEVKGSLDPFDFDMVSDSTLADMWIGSWVEDMPAEQATLWAIFPKLEKPSLDHVRDYLERSNKLEEYDAIAEDWDG